MTALNIAVSNTIAFRGSSFSSLPVTKSNSDAFFGFRLFFMVSLISSDEKQYMGGYC
jgi:hypothetical protein